MVTELRDEELASHYLAFPVQPRQLQGESVVQIVEYLPSLQPAELDGWLVGLTSFAIIRPPCGFYEAQELGPVERQTPRKLQMATVDLD